MNESDASMMDKVAGVVIIGLSFCGACWGLGLTGLGGVLGIAGLAGTGQGGAPVAVVGGIMGIVGFVMVAINAINIASGIGVFQSRRWGFLLACILTGIGLLIGVTGSDGFMSVLPNLLVFGYCLMRLLGKIGLPPQ